jgi:hypothetical protein
MTDPESQQRDLISKAILTPQAFELEEMIIVKNCLKEADEIFDLYFARIKQPLKDRESQILCSSLIRDAVILYTACFTKNPAKRSKYLIPEEAFANVQGWKEYNDWLLNYRDAYAAHIFGDQRQAKAVALFNPEDHSFSELICITVQFESATGALSAGIKTLCNIAIAHAEARINDLMKMVETEVNSLTIEEVKALPDAGLTSPNNVKTSRDETRKRQIKQPLKWERQ